MALPSYVKGYYPVDGISYAINGEILIDPPDLTSMHYLRKLRASSPQRTGLLNINYGTGKVKRIPAYKLEWSFMSVTGWQQLQRLIAEDGFLFTYWDTTIPYDPNISLENQPALKSGTFYADDNGLTYQKMHIAYHQDAGYVVDGYLGVSIEFIADLNDDPEVIAANDFSGESGNSESSEKSGE